VVLGTPMVDKATLRFSGNRTLVVSRDGNGVYVQSVTLDGAPYPNSWLPIAKLHTGATQLHFTMSKQPDKQRGAREEDRPPSFR
jgi:putative alpha-1,2-mannosidase